MGNKGELYLKNGKFYRDGVEVPLEIGNAEQIALIKRIEKEVPEIDISLHTSRMQYIASCCFTCECGNEIVEEKWDCEAESFGEPEPIEEFEGDTIVCEECDREYVVNRNKTVSIKQKEKQEEICPQLFISAEK
ncbi:MAG: hypothetical protein ACRCZB_02495 [Bacteroidales bacterium]